MAKITRLMRGRAAMYEIEKEFLTSPEGQLMGAIINGAVVDLSSKKYRKQAIGYLKGKMPHAILGGVDPDWIRDILIKYKVLTPLHFLRRT